ncbi:flagellar basal body L-ring protein FlgH [Rhodospirillaceae bacterium SYSU D60014]|uniref:flagellar basal body L-ring protein FlgH n=1 Tax=Virgifigura deserti TaxID=2268457 RepID=UPI000E672759
MSPFRKTRSFAALLLIGSALAGCNAASRLSQVGMQPPLTTIQNPTALPNYQPVALPMPAPITEERQANSLWRQGSRAFFKDQRASQIGDILTVVINIEDEAKLNNRTSRSRDAAEGASLPALLGLESTLEKVLPGDADASNLVEAESDSSSSGAGAVNREEDINLRVAALITQVLPNGNLVLSGRQEVRVNYEVRELFVAGVIRPADITSTNTVPYDKIAEARISYGGRGHISDVQQPRYGQQVFDIIFPF